MSRPVVSTFHEETDARQRCLATRSHTAREERSQAFQAAVWVFGVIFLLGRWDGWGLDPRSLQTRQDKLRQGTRSGLVSSPRASSLQPETSFFSSLFTQLALPLGQPLNEQSPACINPHL